jgi:rare lipoprotein A
MFSKIKKIVTIIGLSSFSFLPLNAYAYSGCTSASHYGIGDGYHGLTTANGERYNAYGHSTAHRSLPFGTRLRVTNQSNGKSVIVKVNDRGPFVGGRTLDLSYGAFSSIASPSQGVARVCYTRL